MDVAGGRKISVRFHVPHGRDEIQCGDREAIARDSGARHQFVQNFLAYKGAFGIDDTELYHTLKLAKELGVIVTAHCENETLIAERSKGIARGRKN